MNKQLDLFHPVPKYDEYLYINLSSNDCSISTIRYLFKKHCGINGVLSPLSDSVKDRIMEDLEHYGGFGSLEDYQYHKFIYRHIVNLYWFVNDREDLITPVVHWTQCIAI